MLTWEDRPLRVFGEVVSLAICAKLLFPAPKYKQQTRSTYQDGRDLLLARRAALLDSGTSVMVADEVYNDKAFGDVYEELTKALKPCDAVDVKLASFE